MVVPTAATEDASLMIECPTCGTVSDAADVASDFNGCTYEFACCGSRHNFNPETPHGVARLWLEAAA